MTHPFPYRWHGCEDRLSGNRHLTGTPARGFPPGRSQDCKETSHDCCTDLSLRFFTLSTPIPSGPGGSISWTGSDAQIISASSRVNSGSDELLDVGVDWFNAANITYTGYTVEFGGQTFAIFGRPVTSTGGAQYTIPYNPADGVDLAPLANGGSSTGYTPTGAQVFNCFATGTRIATPDGDKPIEMLRAGDLVLTHDGRSAPAIWRARQSIVNPRNLSVGRSPVRIDAGALGPNLPDAPLTVTADHALLFGDMLINAGTLVNGTTIRLLPLEEMPARFNYWHVELEEHQCVVANGVPAESFIDYVGRSGFDNYDDYLDLVGADRLIAEMPLPRVCAHRLVPPDLRAARGIEPPSYMPRKTAA